MQDEPAIVQIHIQVPWGFLSIHKGFVVAAAGNKGFRASFGIVEHVPAELVAGEWRAYPHAAARNAETPTQQEKKIEPQESRPIRVWRPQLSFVYSAAGKRPALPAPVSSRLPTAAP
jgi:hypothetical protein